MQASSPMLPPELERIIFEIAALARPTFIPRLMRTARRVKIWVEPLLYRSVFIPVIYLPDSYNIKGFPRFTVDQLLCKPPSFLQSTVKYMYLDREFDDLEELETLLRTCGGVHTLALFGAPRLRLQGLSSDLLPGLRRLSVDWASLFGHQSALVAHPLLHNLTHLEILSLEWSSRTQNLFADLAVLPHLTHFALNNLPYDYIQRFDALRIALRGNLQLSHVVLLSSNMDELRAAELLAEDIRFMCTDFENRTSPWTFGIDSGDDFWTLAEVFIAARRAGKVDRSMYIVPRGDESWRTGAVPGSSRSLSSDPSRHYGEFTWITRQFYGVERQSIERRRSTRVAGDALHGDDARVDNEGSE
ncbi:hypothetical protein B0H16DRAFT_423717 [Mycena metata]|uniref:Uncharacterized protein n=1 Tax=Mycena metata TaxID=1033252 RepID=A0AAD7HDV0_9AGAR|nr:hypothetical protein B0H16DRAFT_423717 [Mycena metata]